MFFADTNMIGLIVLGIIVAVMLIVIIIMAIVIHRLRRKLHKRTSAASGSWLTTCSRLISCTVVCLLANIMTVTITAHAISKLFPFHQNIPPL